MLEEVTSDTLTAVGGADGAGVIANRSIEHCHYKIMATSHLLAESFQ